MRTRSSWRIAFSSASFFGFLPTHMGASVRFSSTVRCGKRLNCWNTMPTSRRIFSIAFTSSVISVPVHDDAALLVLLQPVDAADQRGLARARRPADHDALAGVHDEVDVAQDVEIVPVPLVDLLEGDDGFGHGSS